MTVFLYDSFTDTDGTPLGSHVGEINAVWVSNISDGNLADGSADEVGIYSGRLRRNSAFSGRYLCYSPSAPGLTDTDILDVTFDAQRANTVSGSEILVYKNAASAGNSDLLAGVFFHTGVAQYDLALRNGASNVFSAVYPESVGTPLSIRIHIDNTALELYVDDVLILSGVMTPAGNTPVGVSVDDYSGTQSTSVGFFKIETAAPPTAFWTNRVKTQEII